MEYLVLSKSCLSIINGIIISIMVLLVLLIILFLYLNVFELTTLILLKLSSSALSLYSSL